MIETLKENLYDILKSKKVSLVMLYNREGEILWHRGRKIIGERINIGRGIPVSLIEKNMCAHEKISDKDRFIAISDDHISESARKLLIKNILIFPLDHYFLYIDSGSIMDFTEVEIEKITLLSQLLHQAFFKIRRQNDISGLTGEGELMGKITEHVLKFSIEEECVLLTGETGVGKSHIAELIHRYSGRTGRFVVCDTTTINEELFESEVYGHRKGAFTGAVADKKGLVDIAEKGTLFFDEISEVAMSFQAKLLRFIETKRYRVLGDPHEKEADVRIITATNRNLMDMIANKQFREDLFFRLNILSIKIPPLRERKEDIRKFVNEKLDYLKGKELGEKFWDVLLNYNWPGNIRELFTILKRAGVLCDSPIKGEDISCLLREGERIQKYAEKKTKISQIWHRLESGEDFWQVIKEPYLDRELNRNEVKSVIQKAMHRCKNKYVNTLKLFNLSEDEYKKFIKFLIRNRLTVD